ncbi:MAG: hypothetical protein ACI8RN_000910 [Glaciecola sp.]|jgi:hypothetical protein
MDLEAIWITFTSWASAYTWQVIVTLAVVGLYVFSYQSTYPPDPLSQCR